MPVTVRIVGTPLVDQWRKKLSDEKMREAGVRLSVQIVNRTVGGRDEDGRPFTPYKTRRTLKARTSVNYVPRKLGQTVDLHDTGQMLDDLTVTAVTKRGFAIAFRTSRSARLARIHQEGRGNMPERRFLGIPQAWLRDLARSLFSKGR